MKSCNKPLLIIIVLGALPTIYINRLSVTTLAFIMRISCEGLSWPVVGVLPIRWIIFIPLCTLPNIVCFPSSQGVGASVTKNWEPLELGPELAIQRTPAPVCFNALVNSSSNFPPNMLSPPLPVPVGSPPCTIWCYEKWQASLSILHMAEVTSNIHTTKWKLTKSLITRWNIVSL